MAKSWLAGLSDEDVSFVKRFVLASGSLKELAKAYGITYPTVRIRLDRLIEKVKVLDSQEIVSEFERMPKTKIATLNLRIDPGVKEAVREAADRDHRSIANMIEMLIRRHCDDAGITIPEQSDLFPEKHNG